MNGIVRTIHESDRGMDKPGQKYGLERIVEVDGGQRVRLVVDVDSSYPRQSRLFSEVWTDGGWKQVAHIHGEDPMLPDTGVGYVPPARSSEKEVVVEEIAERLLDATLEVIR